LPARHHSINENKRHRGAGRTVSEILYRVQTISLQPIIDATASDSNQAPDKRSPTGQVDLNDSRQSADEMDALPEPARGGNAGSIRPEFYRECFDGQEFRWSDEQGAGASL
ncbi:MAG: hypothetical protein ABSG16_22045, partial [Candidatus Acidiferrum sp.]